MRRLWLSIPTAALALSLAACGGQPVAPAPTAPAADSATATDGPAQLVAATFTTALDENQAPTDEVVSFHPEDTVYFSMQFAGRPRSGLVRSVFTWGDQELASAEVDLAEANSGVIFSIGERTYVGFHLTPSQPLPISGNYRVNTFLDGRPLSSYPFSIVPAAGALPSTIHELTLARDVSEQYEPIEPADTFLPNDTVYLVGRADLGRQSWIQADWYIDGELAAEGTRSLTMEENMADGGFSFSFVPEGGWPLGEHRVALTLNDEEVERLTFTVVADAGPDSGDQGGFTSYSGPNGVYRIDVPADWTQVDASEPGIVSVTFTDSDELAGAIVQVMPVAGELGADELASRARDYLEGAFGGEQDFMMGEAEEQRDGSQRILWQATTTVNGDQVTASGMSFIEQRGDKVALLTIFVPADRYEALEETIVTMLSSYRIDPRAALE